jgi:hypothetical protein
MPGEFITCSNCQGWPSCETGWVCLTCGDDGQVWEEYPDTDIEGARPNCPFCGAISEQDHDPRCGLSR